MITNLSIGYNGRLGNQMFQLACLVALSEAKGYEIALPTENFKPDNEDGYNDGSQLRDCFNIPDQFFRSRSEIMNRIAHQYREPKFSYSDDFFSLPDGTDVNGYYQSERYFKNSENRIREIFSFKKWISDEADLMYSKLDIDESSICVHVRRGDYIAQSDYHPVLKKEYYSEALCDMKGKVFLFSDDYEWCRDNVSDLYPESTIVEKINPYVSLCLMSRFKKFIIANSSFSWWAAWLSGEASDVVAPSIWFGKMMSHSTEDLYCKGWKIV
jgi:hypothetical protein